MQPALHQRLGALLSWLAAGPLRRREELDPTPAGSLLSRGEALAGGTSALVLVLLGLLPRALPGVSSASSSQSLVTPGPAAGSGSGSSNASDGAQKVGTMAELPVNSALTFNDPRSGDPSVVVHCANGKVAAYDAVCTHAGCTVEYDQYYKLLVCPCHGGAFDPAQGAQVVAGPPFDPLPSLPIKVDKQGNIYVS